MLHHPTTQIDALNEALAQLLTLLVVPLAVASDQLITNPKIERLLCRRAARPIECAGAAMGIASNLIHIYQAKWRRIDLDQVSPIDSCVSNHRAAGQVIPREVILWLCLRVRSACGTRTLRS